MSGQGHAIYWSQAQDECCESDMTTFVFVLLLIIGENTEQALLRDDPSMTISASVIITLLFLDIVMSLARQR